MSRDHRIVYRFYVVHMSTIGLAVLAIVATYLYCRESNEPYCSEADHEKRLRRVTAGLKKRPPGAKLSLHRRTLQSNTIRNASHKSHSSYFPVDLSSFNHIIRIESDYVTCEPGVPFGDLLRELLKVGMTTLVVPELPGITVGGAIAGGGLESSSHRHGQVSDTVLEIECLTPELRVCSPEVDPDLFYAISASYNTVALLTRVKMRIQPAPEYISVKAERYGTFKEAIAGLEGEDTVEGIVYAPDDILVIRGRHTNRPNSPVVRFNRHWDEWYYKRIHRTREMCIPYFDYCFRYNYGSFWMANYVLDMLGGDNFLTRLLIGAFLDTKHLFAVLHSSKLTDLGRMRIIQDLYIPRDRAVEFLEDVERDIGVYPLWLCPIKGTNSQVLASHHGKEEFINVGIYGRPRNFPFKAGEIHSRLIDSLIRYQGRSMLYAQTWHTRGQFQAIYGEALEEVEDVRRKYGEGCFFDLYQKVALSQEERDELNKPMPGSETEAMKKVVRDIIRSKVGL